MAGPLPRIDGTSTIDRPRPIEQPEQIEEREAKPTEPYSSSMEHVRRVDALLPMKHRIILSKKIRQLQDSGAKLQDGTKVTDKTKAILWILENEVK